ncbi:MAG: hypothetical protein FWC03_11765 [Treponema sp.]|nr:hypothetical protein [Treponema sp.]MCL2245121.1 hypothetical protein [Treponema sp.]
MSVSEKVKKERKIRRKLKNMKTPMHKGRTRVENPKKTRSARRPRRVIWNSDRKKQGAMNE